MTTPARPPRLIVCADDYAFTPGISRSIRELLMAKRISATSVMTAQPYWPVEAPALKDAAGDADIGLHVTLTDQASLGPLPIFAPSGTFPPMGAVHKAGALHRLPMGEIRDEIRRQADAFVKHYGRTPAHIDGHHHVQQLPGVREILIELAASMSPRPWVRVSGDKPALQIKRGVATAKALVIGVFGAGMKRRALAARVPYNDGFSGAYDFNAETRPLAQLFARFLMGVRENTLIMSHPGHSDATLRALDVMVEARDKEHAFFMSEEWPALLAQAGLDLGPYRR